MFDENNQNELLNENIVDDDQGLYMMSLFKNPELFKLNYLGKNNWFSLFEKYLLILLFEKKIDIVLLFYINRL